MSAEDKVRLFVLDIVDAAVRDAQSGVPERHKTNVGAELLRRLNLPRHRTTPRHGDKYEARRVYTAARFLYRTELKED